ncbi:Ankyrin repeat protein 2 [Giardia duodenalis]|uniref:Ankyrin repeat protein 2 n=1 Tax=Giardia intestinalis (strain ATCC 50803 / WB clone C6) TaxID=184922 RepID=A8BPS6_GIAIC|nr:Ankyrin repeat protein 2 [Giardia intestinalis]KAE8304358.1 Ankyrin repeat protein 2 [Giardia intestinalis]|eukprot:XP_001705663.1 Protein 21.1 [Giardia lamblia ATCC 50803]
MNNNRGASSEETAPSDDGNEKLLQAVISQDINELKSLIAAGTCLCKQDRTGMTALMHAAAQGSILMTGMLVEYEKGLKDSNGKMALHHALRGGHVDVAGLLLSYEDPRDRNGVTALMRASAIGDMEVVVHLVKLQGAVQTINSGSYKLESGTYSFNEGATALMFAAWYGQSEAAKVLLGRESRIRDNGRLTALMYAAERGYIEVVKELRPRESRMQNWLGRTALMFAAQNGHMDVVRLLLEDEKQMVDGNGWTALMYAASNGHVEIACLLLDHEKCVQDNDGWSALMFAAYYGYTDMVGLLLSEEKGLRDSKGRTALMHAAEKGNVDAVKLLVGYEARAQTYAEYTALMLAAYANHAEVATVLLPYEGGMQTTIGWTALMEAALYGHTEVISVLMQCEGGLHRNDGCTALIYTAYEGQEEMVKLLFDLERESSGWTKLMYAASLGLTATAGAHLSDAGQQDNIGLTALMYAVRNCRTEMVKLLATHECGFQDSGGWTALMHATLCGYRDLIRPLLCEAGSQSLVAHRNYPPGTTALMIAAYQNDAYTVDLLASLEAGFLNSDDDCALILALQNASAECIPLLLCELSVLDSHGKACYFRIHTLDIDESPKLTLLYERLRDTLKTMFFSGLQKERLACLLTALTRSVSSLITSGHFLLELMWAALLCEYDNVITDLDEQFVLIEDAYIEDTCAICLTRPPDCVLLPCRHLIVCLACVDRIYANKSCCKCPYCRTPIETILDLAECNFTLL